MCTIAVSCLRQLNIDSLTHLHLCVTGAYPKVKNFCEEVHCLLNTNQLLRQFPLHGHVVEDEDPRHHPSQLSLEKAPLLL